MSLENSQNQDLNLGKIDVDYSLTKEEVVEILKLTKNFDGENLNNQINNQKISKLINRDYSQINNARLSTYSKYGVNMLTFQKKLVKLGFDLGSSGKNENGIDGLFGKITFLAIVKIQKIIGIEPNGIINIDLLGYLYPSTFRTRNKNEGFGNNKEDVTDSLQLKIKEYNEQKDLVKDESKDLIGNLLSELTDSQNEIIIPKKEKIKIKDKKIIKPKEKKHTGRTMYATDINETIEPEIKFYGIGKVRKNPGDEVTNCAGINRQTLKANGINGFHYTAKGKTYSYLQHLLNPKTRDTLLFRRPGHEKITEPKHLFLASDLSPTNSKRFLKTREGDLIQETKTDNFDGIETSINNGDMISIVMDSRTTDGKKYGHMATGMKIDGKLYIVDPVFLHKKEPILYSNYIEKLNAKKLGTRNMFNIRGIIVYDKSNNTNKSYLASIVGENIQIASNDRTANQDMYN